MVSKRRQKIEIGISQAKNRRKSVPEREREREQNVQKSEDEKYGAFQQLQALGFRIAVEWVWFRKMCAAALSPRGFQTHSKGNEEALKRLLLCFLLCVSTLLIIRTICIYWILYSHCAKCFIISLNLQNSSEK